MFREISKIELSPYKPRITDLVELAARGAKSWRFREGAVWLDPQLLKKSGRLERLITTLQSVRQICHNDSVVIFTKKNEVDLNLPTVQVGKKYFG